MRILAVIPARGGSKGLPGKHLRLFAGRPLIAHTISPATGCAELDRVLVSTDAPEIADAARSCGAEAPFLRPAELARDETPGLAPILHAVRWLEEYQGYRPDYVMVLQATSPLRTLEDLRAAIHLARAHRAEGVVSVCEAPRHPFWMKRIDAAGRLSDFLPGEDHEATRQELPPVYALNGAVYLVRRDVLLERDTLCPEAAYAYLMPPERSIDIDTAFDFELAEYLFTKHASTNPARRAEVAR